MGNGCSLALYFVMAKTEKTITEGPGNRGWLVFVSTLCFTFLSNCDLILLLSELGVGETTFHLTKSNEHIL